MNKGNHTVNRGTLSDGEIVELYWQRNERAIQETDIKYKKYLYTIAYNILNNALDSEECLNDTYLGTWNTIPPQRPTVFQAFLSKIMRNTAVGKYRSNAALKRGSSEMILSLDELGDCVPYPSSVEEEYLMVQLGSIINDYIKTLNDRSTFIFICRYWCFDRVRDIADMLHISERTVFNELSAIRDGLKEVLIKEGYFNE